MESSRTYGASHHLDNRDEPEANHTGDNGLHRLSFNVDLGYRIRHGDVPDWNGHSFPCGELSESGKLAAGYSLSKLLHLFASWNSLLRLNRGNRHLDWDSAEYRIRRRTKNTLSQCPGDNLFSMDEGGFALDPCFPSSDLVLPYPCSLASDSKQDSRWTGDDREKKCRTGSDVERGTLYAGDFPDGRIWMGLSMWISDTASAMVMFPIGMAILFHVENSVNQESWQQDIRYQNFSTCLLLGIAYSALIGGIATLIGTPPNIVFAGALKTLYPNAPEITFFQWMKVGLPLTLVFLPLTWYYLTRVALPVTLNKIPGGREMIEKKSAELGPMSKGERYTLVIFLMAVFGWVFRNNIDLGLFTIPGWSPLLGLEKHVNDSTVAIFAALLLFMTPVDLEKREFLLDWEWARRIPWGILILFGGGIALASAVKSSGVSSWIGEGLSGLSVAPVFFMILGVCLVITFLTEITSNTAVATVFMPIIGAIAVALDLNPILLMVPVALSASCAFMLPVATPPNAIVFSSGKITVPQMARTGLGLNLLGAILITLAIYLLAIPFFGITLTGLPPWALN